MDDEVTVELEDATHPRPDIGSGDEVTPCAEDIVRPVETAQTLSMPNAAPGNEQARKPSSEQDKMGEDVSGKTARSSGASFSNAEKNGQPFFLNVGEVARVTGISRSTINRWIRENPPLMPSVKVGGMRLFPRPVLEEWCRRVAAEGSAPPHRLAQITRQLFDELNRQGGRSGRHGRSASSSSGQRDRANPEVGKGLRLRTRDMYRKYVLGGGDGRGA